MVVVLELVWRFRCLLY